MLKHGTITHWVKGGIKVLGINQNKLAKAVTLAEGGKQNLSIGQVKEVQKLLLTELAKYDDKKVIELLNKFR